MTGSNDNPAAFEAKLDALSKPQDGMWRVRLVVHPNDMPDWLLRAPMGQRIGAAGLHEIHEDAADEPKPEKRHDAQHCAMLCEKDVAWRKFIRALVDARRAFPGTLNVSDDWHSYVDDGEAACVGRTHNVLGITSRARINDDDTVNAEWHKLLSAFKATTGRDTEARR